MSKLRFFNIFFLKPGLTKTFYLMKDFQFSLDGAACFMLENFKKKIMIWVVTVMHSVPYLVGFVWSLAFQKCPNFECPATFQLPSRLSSCVLYQQIREKSTSKSKFRKERLSCFAFFRKVCNIHKKS